mmetsp:Transcript_51084/g.123294  ORF Transcript_51084/g.123294 Transcript_51084/m.123294 type:complete len:213 (+) Transcript_51084:400-1038(+)
MYRSTHTATSPRSRYRPTYTRNQYHPHSGTDASANVCPTHSGPDTIPHAGTYTRNQCHPHSGPDAPANVCPTHSGSNTIPHAGTYTRTDTVPHAGTNSSTYGLPHAGSYTCSNSGTYTGANPGPSFDCTNTIPDNAVSYATSSNTRADSSSYRVPNSGSYASSHRVPNSGTDSRTDTVPYSRTYTGANSDPSFGGTDAIPNHGVPHTTSSYA